MRKSKRSSPDWIVVSNGGSQGKCLRCGDQFNLQLPVLLEVWVAAADAFVKAHSRCMPKEPNA